MFKVMYNFKTVGKYKTFSESFTKLYNQLVEDLKKGASYQFLETAIWIESPFSKDPIMFYEARDIACNIGLLKDGELNPDFPGE